MTCSSNPTGIASSLPTAHSKYDDDNISENPDRTSSTSNEKWIRLRYCKSKVYQHPTPSVKDNIPGYIAFLEREVCQETEPESFSSPYRSSKIADSYLLAWVPESCLGDAVSIYSQAELDEDGSSRKIYSVPLPPITTQPDLVGRDGFAIPISSIYSIHSRLPSPGWWLGSLVINSRAGDPYPALFFHDSECESTTIQKKRLIRESFDLIGASGEIFWGGDQVIAWLSRHLEVHRCELERNMYLIEPSAEDKTAFVRNTFKSESKGSSRDKAAIRVPKSQSIINYSTRDPQIDPHIKFIRDMGWNIAEKLSRVTNYARRTADSVVENPNIPSQVRRLLRNPEVQTLQEEFDSARIYIAKWAMGIAEQSERDRNQRNLVARRTQEVEQTDVGGFELLNAEVGALSVREERKVVTLTEWNSFFDQNSGILIYTIDEVKERIFHGGLDAEDGVRKEAWLFLLQVYKWDSTAKERRQEISRIRDEYVKLKGAWWNRFADRDCDNEEAELWREQRSRIEKDVHRTDRTIPLFAGEDIPHPDPASPFADVGTNVHLEQLKDMLLTYNEFNRDLGYVQGMSDLLAPIYAVLQDDAIAFWAFKNFMYRMERNFLRDQSGMRRQLLTLENLVQLMDPKLYLHLQSAESTNFFFFFRMLLVWFKREFDWEEVLRLWEGLWTDYLSSNFHLFIALAILEKHRDVIMDHLKRFDEVLKYINELSSTINLEMTLIRAEILFRRFQEKVDTIDKKSSFPSPKVRLRTTTSHSQRKMTTNTSISSGNDAATTASGGCEVNTEETLPEGKIQSVNSENKNNLTPATTISSDLRELLSREVKDFPRN